MLEDTTTIITLLSGIGIGSLGIIIFKSISPIIASWWQARKAQLEADKAAVEAAAQRAEAVAKITIGNLIALAETDINDIVSRVGVIENTVADLPNKFLQKV